MQVPLSFGLGGKRLPLQDKLVEHDLTHELDEGFLLEIGIVGGAHSLLRYDMNCLH